MKTNPRIARIIANAERWAESNPGKPYRKTVIRDSGDLVCVPRHWYEECCIESEYVGEVFAIKERGCALYSSMEFAR